MNTPCAHIIDDDEAIREALQWLLKTRKIPCSVWASAEDFLAAVLPDWSGCVVLDIRMEGMSGLECFDELRTRQNTLPVIFITGHGDVPMAVAALKNGAHDFIEKPFNDSDLVTIIQRAMEIDSQRRQTENQHHAVSGKLQLLTAREREVMSLILEGKYNKVIADELNISMRTVEAHRSRIFEKMSVRSAVELAQMLKGVRF